MNIKLQLATMAFPISTVLQVCAQGYIVPNGVFIISPPEISVVHNPATAPSGGSYTGFEFIPVGKTPPTIVTNTFLYESVLDIGVRVFLVSPNDPISLQPILAQSYTELGLQPTYVFANGVPFYVGLYTGNMTYSPPDRIYTDPLFGWAELENVGGTIQLLNGALEYQGGGIYAGTQNILPTPEPGIFGLSALGALLLGWRVLRRRRRGFKLQRGSLAPSPRQSGPVRKS
jgi:hypothetical protein